MRAILSIIVIATAVVGFICPAGWAEIDDPVFQRLENATKARELYLQGEAAMKRGAVEDAVACWMKVMELKPDSAYTAKCLASARQRLWSDYAKRSDASLKSSDRIGAYMVLESVAPLLPGNADLDARKKSVFTLMSENERKAADACRRVLEYLGKSYYSQAEESAREASTYGSGSRYVQNLSALVAEAKSRSAAGAPVPSSGPAAQTAVLMTSRGGQASLKSCKLEPSATCVVDQSETSEDFATGKITTTGGASVYLKVSGQVVNNTDKPVEYIEIEFQLLYKGQPVKIDKGRLWDVGGPIQPHATWRFETEEATGVPGKYAIEDYQVKPIRLEVDNSVKTGSVTVQ